MSTTGTGLAGALVDPVSTTVKGALSEEGGSMLALLKILAPAEP